jgi:hypothetical protein
MGYINTSIKINQLSSVCLRLIINLKIYILTTSVGEHIAMAQKKNGEIRICVNSRLKILGEIHIDGKNDDFDRFWI